MNSQHAHRLTKALIQHGRTFLIYLKDFAHTGYCTSAMYLYSGEDTLAIGLDGYDIRAMKLTRDDAHRLIALIEPNFDAYLEMCQRYAVGEVKRNPPVAVVSRVLKHGSSELHSSKRTSKAKIARKIGFEQDRKRAAAFNKLCSKPSMMSSGKHRDKLPITIHTPKPTGLL